MSIPTNTTYRPDIDGLRAIAVLLVVLYHGGIQAISGGYIGVDVFFVISGFLITGIIVRQIEQGSFSFVDFYIRRIKRLMPALFLVLFASIPLFTFILLPHDLQNFYQSIVWICLYFANIFFWREHGGYFGGNAQEAPLLHTWSLAVEEQFYFIWPVTLFLLALVFHQKVLKWVLGLMLIFTIALSEWATQSTISAAYYLLPSRFFELLIGGFLAVLLPSLSTQRTSMTNLSATAGMAMILIPAFTYNLYTSFPGFGALIPTVGTAILIFSGNSWVSRILSTKPLVFIGQISYSMYLVHWPVFAAIRYTGYPLEGITQITALLSVFGLAYLAWRFVEKPFRSLELANSLIFRRYFLYPVSLCCLIAVTGIVFDGYPGRYSQQVIDIDLAYNSHSNDSRNGCHVASRDALQRPTQECLFPKNSSEASVFLIGDSHANHHVGMLGVWAEEAGRTIQDYTLDRCLPLNGLRWGPSNSLADICHARNELAYEHIENNNFDYVVLAGSWPGSRTSSLRDVSSTASEEEKRFLLSETLKNSIARIEKNRS